jgi:hypothetical protein
MKEKSFSILALVISILSLLVAFGSVYYSKVAYDLSNKSYSSDRKIVLNSKIDGDLVYLSALESEHVIASAILYFPSRFELESYALSSPELVVNLSDLKGAVEKLVGELVPKRSHSQTMEHFSIPVVVSIKGYSKGETSIQTSTYNAVYRVFVDNNIQEVKLKNFVIEDSKPEILDPVNLADKKMQYKIELFQEANSL